MKIRWREDLRERKKSASFRADPGEKKMGKHILNMVNKKLTK